jgi:uncharacterized protein YneF (UPF0154 family)
MSYFSMIFLVIFDLFLFVGLFVGLFLLSQWFNNLKLLPKLIALTKKIVKAMGS